MDQTQSKKWQKEERKEEETRRRGEWQTEKRRIHTRTKREELSLFPHQYLQLQQAWPVSFFFFFWSWSKRRPSGAEVAGHKHGSLTGIHPHPTSSICYSPFSRPNFKPFFFGCLFLLWHPHAIYTVKMCRLHPALKNKTRDSYKKERVQ